MATAGPVVTELPAQEVRFLFGTMMDLRMLPNELKHTGNIAEGEFKIVAHFPAIHKTNGTESNYLARHKTFRGGLYSTYQDGPYKIDEVNWDATNRAGVHMVTMTKYGQTVEFPTQPSKTMPGSLKLMVQEYVESLKVPGFVIRCSGLGGALEPKKGTTDEYNVILLSGDAKCPKKLANHVPAKYHAEDESIFHAQVGPWCGNAESFEASGSGDKMTFGRMEWSWDTDEDDVEEDRINDLIEDEIQQDGAESGSGTLTEQNEEGVSYDISYRWNHVMTDYNTAETGYHGAESFEANGSGDKMTFGRMEWSWDCDEDDVDEDRINDLIEDQIQQDGAESGSGTLTEQNEEGFSYDVDYRWNHVMTDYNTAETGYHGAESFAAASRAGADLPREKRNVLSSVKNNYDSSFSWSACNWGPYFNRYAAEGSNKFYSVWVWERSPGIYTAMGAYGGLGQNPRLFNVGQTRDLQQAVNMAKKKLQSKQKKGYQTYTAEQMTQLGDSSYPVIPNTGGGDSALGSGRGVPQWYGAEEFEAPMPFHSPSKGDVNKVIKSIRDRHKGIRLQGSPTYLTERKGGSNKYHVFQMTNRGGFNGYGRIGHTMTVFGPMSPKQYQLKLISKMKKGYKETGY